MAQVKYSTLNGSGIIFRAATRLRPQGRSGRQLKIKGYLFTAITVLMFLSLFMTAYYFFVRSSARNSPDISAEKTAATYDDATWDIKTILQVGAKIDGGDSTTISLWDSIPSAWDINASLKNYSAYMNGQYSNETNSAISLDTSAISSSTTSIDFLITPQEYAYGYDSTAKNSIRFRNLTSGVEASAINLTLDLRGEGINDLIWLEAEDSTPVGDETIAADQDASQGEYVQDFNILARDIQVPLNLNYTLWVRGIIDNSSKNYTIEVDGRNSTRFDVRDWNAQTPRWEWFNHPEDVYNMTPGDKVVKVYAEPSSGTDSIDVILLTTKRLSPPNVAPITRPPDQLEYSNTSGGDLSFALEAMFANANYTFVSDSLARNSSSEWNFTFNDEDIIRIMLQGGQYVMSISLNDSINASSAKVNATFVLPPTGETTYISTGCSLETRGPITRKDGILLAKG